jgi:uncharacterized protein (DUF697 family)
MNRFSTLTSFWQNIREADLRPYREQAVGGVRLAIVGEPGSGGDILSEQIRRDPNRPQIFSDAPVLLLDLDTAGQAPVQADLIILMVTSSTEEASRADALVRLWQNSAKRVLVLINQPEDAAQASSALSPWTSRLSRRVVIGSPHDTQFLLQKFAPAVIEILPERLLALGRSFPLFRIPIAHHLINDTSFANAAYSLSTGFAELVPVLNIPFTITDTIVLTKAQAFLVYKLGLAFGYSTRWQDYLGEFGGVLGSGFFWRQLARSLVGLIPFWGILPKTAIAYAGTYVVGNVVLQWYLTGRHLSRKQMSVLYSQALDRGKALASTLLKRLPHPRLPRLGKPKPKPALPAPRSTRAAKRQQVCAHCGKTSASDALFCQYCSTPFTASG